MATIVVAPGGGNWTTGATWVGGVAPTAADNAVAQASSGNLTIDSGGAVARSFDCTSGTGSYVGTLTHNAGATLTLGDATAGAGNVALKFSSGMTYTKGSTTTSAISYFSTSATQQTITHAGKVPGNAQIGDTSHSGSYQLADAWIASSATFVHSKGTFDSNGATVTCSIFNTNTTNIRVWTMGSSTYNVAAIVAVNLTGLTLNSGTSTLNINQFSGGGLQWGTGTGIGGTNGTFYDVNLSSGGAETFGNGNMTFHNLAITHTGTTASTAAFTTGNGLLSCNNFTFTGAGTVLVTLTLGGPLAPSGTFLVNGATIANRLIIRTVTTGTAVTITAAVVGAGSNTNFMDITGAGAGSWNIAGWTGGSGDMQGNSGITFTTAVDRYAVVAGNGSSTAMWSNTSGGAGGTRVPLPQDNVFFDANSAAGTYTLDSVYFGKNVVCTGFTRTLAVSAANQSWFGSVTLSTGMTFTQAALIILRGRAAITWTSAGKNSSSITYAGPTGSLTLQDAMVNSGDFQVNNGQFFTNNQSFTINTFALTGTLARGATFGTSTVTTTSTATATVWNPGSTTGLTFSAASATIVVSGVSSNTRTFAGGGQTYGTLTHTVSNSFGLFAITGSNTFGTLNVFDNVAQRTLQFQNGTTTTILTAAGWNVHGRATALITINTPSAGSSANISCPSGVITTDYLTLKDSHAIGGARWHAGLNSTDVSGNTGWIFRGSPSGDFAAAA